ncbi:MAG: hypothetical protein QOG64_719, partial [Acidimicrobiaceae bacterium]|nr:hypothetical protein [Acidimicrobiaceae bacterium]
PGPPTNKLVVTDVRSGATFARPTGANAGDDIVLTPPTVSGSGSGSSTTVGAAATTTTVSPNSGTPSDIPPPNADSTKEGTVAATASTTGHPPSLAIDGDRTSSWGAAATATFNWVGARDDNIVSVKLLGVSGFTSVTVQVLDSGGDVDFTQRQVLSSGDAEIKPGVTGRAVRLNFEGAGELPELQIGVFR